MMRPISSSRGAVLASLLLCAGCSEPADSLRQYQVKQTPTFRAEPVQVGAALEYLGHELEVRVATPGGAVVITHYWHVLKSPKAGSRISSQLKGKDEADWMNIDASPLRAAAPLSAWPKGAILRDRQTFSMKSDWRSTSAELSVAVTDKDGKVLSGIRETVARFRVDAARAKGYAIRKASGPITIDGKADEESWKGAALSPPFTTAEGGRPIGFETLGQLLWDEQHLYLFARVQDTDIYSQYKGRDDPLWKEDVVEIFIDADRNRRGYVELQVNPNNAHFDAWFKGTRANGGDFPWNSKMKSAVQIDGTAGKRGDRDKGWTLELAIPWNDVRGRDQNMKIKTPPQVGDQWRLNVIRVDKPEKQGLAASSWNPITIRDFHALGRMLEVTFANEFGEVQRAAPAPVLP